MSRNEEKSDNINDSEVKWKRSKKFANKFANKWKRRVVYEETESMHKFLKNSVREIILLGKNKNENNISKEDFSEMCLRLGYDAEFLESRKEQLSIESRGMYALALVAVFVTFYSFSSMNLLLILSAIMMIFVFSISGFIRAFRVWQIEKRELKSFEEWLKAYEDWIV